MAIAATAAAPAATVIGTRKRRQCSQARAGRDGRRAGADQRRRTLVIVEIVGPERPTREKPEKAITPPTKASSSRIDGSAMRRLAVKNRARPQAVAATSNGAIGEGPS